MGILNVTSLCQGPSSRFDQGRSSFTFLVPDTPDRLASSCLCNAEGGNDGLNLAEDPATREVAS